MFYFFFKGQNKIKQNVKASISCVHTRVLYYALFSCEDLNIIAKKKRILRICQADSVGKYGLCAKTEAGTSLAP